jgi:alkaline phosphatase D
MHRGTAILIIMPILATHGGSDWKAHADQKGASLELGPLLGHTAANEARIWIKASAPATSGIIIGETSRMERARQVRGPRLTLTTDYTGVVLVTGLRPATRYYYKVVIDGAPEPDPPSSFTTAPSEGAPGRLRFATTSCIDIPESAARSWAELAKTPVDLLLQLGDNAYVDSTDPAEHRRKFYGHRKVPAYRALARGMPTLAIWDDWDYAGNNSDGTEPGKERSLRVFKELWPNPSFGHSGDPGIYFKFSWGDVDFFMLDGRYHRSPNHLEDDGRKSMLGAAQLAWLKRELAVSRATLKFLVSGVQWQSQGRSDSWAGFMRERDDLFGHIEAHGIDGVVLLSGDRHVTAGYQVRGRFVEITSSPFAEENQSPPYNPDEMFMLHDKGNFFVVLDVNTDAAAPSLSVEVHQVGRGLVRRRSFSWREINGKTPILTCEFLMDCRK